ncbi:hypothetical protein [Salipaludibacillus agaradhaerens]|jgi:hypothetical protein|uniref:hypothetical protein n=1 Tax=Salipaludibacillus agaradhaerens TaxID=76935 RepID=UPI001473781B|nr:hypothetical protein [Salipaludibacillus agaradhaerens]
MTRRTTKTRQGNVAPILQWYPWVKAGFQSFHNSDRGKIERLPKKVNAFGTATSIVSYF